MQGQMVGEGGLAEAMATIFVWLRYSSSRQLTWQRNYNTQPRILGEAQNRLTHAIAKVNTPHPHLVMHGSATRPDAIPRSRDRTITASAPCTCLGLEQITLETAM